MTHYVIHFNQQWVGDHTADWFAARGPLARAVVEEMKAAGVYVFAGGMDEDVTRTFHAVPTGEESADLADGLYAPDAQYVGGMTIIDVADDDAARFWTARIAVACGWPQEARRIAP